MTRKYYWKTFRLKHEGGKEIPMSNWDGTKSLFEKIIKSKPEYKW
jgi:hypothetical protein